MLCAMILYFNRGKEFILVWSVFALIHLFLRKMHLLG